jgi:hypothetical protein
MAPSRGSQPQASAAPAVRPIVADLERELDALAARVVERIREEVPAFRRLTRVTLGRAVDGNLRRALAALEDLRPPTPMELEGSAAVGRERAEQGLSVEDVLHAHRVTVGVLWGRFGELARERGADVASVLAFSETLWRWADTLMEVVAAGHRDVELQLAREEQQRRDAFVVTVLTGRVDPAELGRDSAAQGLDPERSYLPFRARARDPDHAHGLSRRLGLGLAGEAGLVATLDGDLVGVAVRAPDPVAGVTTGIGPAVRLSALPSSFALASRALQTALAFGQDGVHSLSDLSVRPAILVDEALGDAFVERYLGPLAELGRLGTELEATLRTFFEHDLRVEDTARALFVHPNTLRHRVRRFEEATGASLRRPGDIVEVWWALERRQLSGRTNQAPP